MSSLTRLEAAGIEVVKALHRNMSKLEKTLGIYGNPDRNASNLVLEVVEQWEDRGGYPPRTWRTLLDIISQGMNLRELGQQIEDYLQYGGYKIQ